MSTSTPDATLIEIEQRLLWLATRMIDAANRERPAPAAPPGRDAEFQIKVGGHQASSASMVGIMTALWFGHLRQRRQGRRQAACVSGVPRHQVPHR